MAEIQNEMAEPIRILITDRIAQEGINLLRTQLPEVQIDERLGLNPEQLKTISGINGNPPR